MTIALQNQLNKTFKKVLNINPRADGFDNIQEEELNLSLPQLIFWGLIGRMITIWIVIYLWARVMPQISSSIKSKPGFWNLFGLSVIYSLLF